MIWGILLKSLLEFILSLVLIIGWFILIGGSIGLIISFIAKGMYIIIPISAIVTGLVCIRIHKITVSKII